MFFQQLTHQQQEPCTWYENLFSQTFSTCIYHNVNVLPATKAYVAIMAIELNWIELNLLGNFQINYKVELHTNSLIKHIKEIKDIIRV